MQPQNRLQILECEQRKTLNRKKNLIPMNVRIKKIRIWMGDLKEHKVFFLKMARVIRQFGGKFEKNNCSRYRTVNGHLFASLLDTKCHDQILYWNEIKGWQCRIWRHHKTHHFPKIDSIYRKNHGKNIMRIPILWDF